jgi:hypothetical protein
MEGEMSNQMSRSGLKEARKAARARKEQEKQDPTWTTLQRALSVG